MHSIVKGHRLISYFTWEMPWFSSRWVWNSTLERIQIFLDHSTSSVFWASYRCTMLSLTIHEIFIDPFLIKLLKSSSRHYSIYWICVSRREMSRGRKRILVGKLMLTPHTGIIFIRYIISIRLIMLRNELMWVFRRSSWCSLNIMLWYWLWCIKSC
jgi:hypothetical protein